jgi:hypothetical protein
MTVKVLVLISSIIIILLHCGLSYVLTTTRDDGRFIEISNSFIVLHYSVVDNNIDYISSDFHGTRNFTRNILAKPFQLSVRRASRNSSSIGGGDDDVDDKHSDFEVEGNNYQWLVKTEHKVSLKVTGIVDSHVNPIAEEVWVITLRDNQRSFSVSITGITIASLSDDIWTTAIYQFICYCCYSTVGKVIQSAAVINIVHGVYLHIPSLNGLFDSGRYSIY